MIKTKLRKEVAVTVPIQGAIVPGRRMPFSSFFTPVAFSDDIVNYIDELNKSKAGAVIFEINSPGGEAYASKQIGDAIKRLNKPKVALIKAHGTSGAYWIASACDKIIADPLSDVGSIGTITTHFNLSELLEKIGIDVKSLSTGKFKDVGSPFKKMSKEGEEFIKEHLEAVNKEFVNEIKANRKIEDEETLKKLTSGKPFLGREAQELGLVDHLGDRTKAMEVACELAGKTLVLKPYIRRRTLLERFLERW
ncbi:MAG: signal peptide peptidase SppA [Halobacteriota archaeon]|nr:signal peptide peptidase SppA [Halobacteriota archaeon]